MKVIVIGGGEIGFYLADRLTRERKDVVLIDNDPERVELAREQFDIQAILGDGSSPRVLKRAGLQDAEMIVAVTTSDEVNMIACLLAQSQSHVPVKLARIRNLEYVNDSRILGADYLGIDRHINPEMEAAEKIVNLCRVPAAGSVIEVADGRLQICSVTLPPGNGLIGHKLKDLPEFSPQNNALICAIQRAGVTLIPTGATVIEEEDVLWMMSTPDNVHEIMRNIGIKSEPVRRALIFGGTMTGEFVAQKLLDEKIGVKLIHDDRQRCEELARTLDGALILHSNGITSDILEEEGVEENTVFIATSRNDEDNVMASLLAKRMGVAKAITLLDRQTYESIIRAIGVDNVVNRRIAAAEKILQYIRKGKVQSTAIIADTGAEAIEFEALQTSEAVGSPLYGIKFPKGSLVVGIVRADKAIIPRGQDVIEPGDRVVILALEEAIPKVEKIFQVKVDFF